MSTVARKKRNVQGPDRAPGQGLDLVVDLREVNLEAGGHVQGRSLDQVIEDEKKIKTGMSEGEREVDQQTTKTTMTLSIRLTEYFL